MRKSDKELTKKVGQVILDSTVEHIDDMLKATPGLGFAYNLCKSLMGNAMAMRQKRVFEFMEPISKNPDIFTDLMLGTEAFQDGFALTLQNYITIRSEQKRTIVRNVFNSYANQIDKVDFQLERFIDTTRKISPAGIALLALLYTEIIPEKAKHITMIMKSNGADKDPNYSWALRLELDKTADSLYLENWIERHYRPDAENGEIHPPKDADNRDEIILTLTKAYLDKVRYYDEAVNELRYLGLIGTRNNQAAQYNTSDPWKVTDFAKEYMEYIKKV